MKILNVLLMWSLFVGVSYGQQADVIYTAKVKKEKVPTEVLVSIPVDFPGGEVVEYIGVPVTVIQDVIYTHASNDPDRVYDTYLVRIKTNKGVEQATYNSKGVLMSTVYKGTNVMLPQAIHKSIAQAFKGWKIAENHMVMHSDAKGKSKTTYRVRLEKDGQKQVVLYKADGTIVEAHQSKKGKDDMKKAEYKKHKKEGSN